MSMRLGRVIQHARQVRGRTCVGRLTPLRDGDFGYLFGHEAGNQPRHYPEKSGALCRRQRLIARVCIAFMKIECPLRPVQ